MGGADTMIGNGGDDTYVVNNLGDQIVEGTDAGFDTVQSTVTFSLGSGIEQLVLMGTGALSGTGNELDNSIIGNSGNNTLNGGLGLDTLSGGQGNDTYIIDDVGDIIVEAASAGTDTVRTTLQFYQLDANVENIIRGHRELRRDGQRPCEHHHRWQWRRRVERGLGSTL